MDRGPHQRALDDTALLERAGEHRSFEVGHPRPEADVAGRRVLHLDAAHLLDHPLERQARPLEEHLALEERTVQGALGQDLAGHSRAYGDRLSRRGSLAAGELPGLALGHDGWGDHHLHAVHLVDGARAQGAAID